MKIFTLFTVTVLFICGLFETRSLADMDGMAQQGATGSQQTSQDEINQKNRINQLSPTERDEILCRNHKTVDCSSTDSDCMVLSSAYRIIGRGCFSTDIHCVDTCARAKELEKVILEKRPNSKAGPSKGLQQLLDF